MTSVIMSVFQSVFDEEMADPGSGRWNKWIDDEDHLYLDGEDVCMPEDLKRDGDGHIGHESLLESDGLHYFVDLEEVAQIWLNISLDKMSIIWSCCNCSRIGSSAAAVWTFVHVSEIRGR